MCVSLAENLKMCRKWATNCNKQSYLICLIGLLLEARDIFWKDEAVQSNGYILAYFSLKHFIHFHLDK